MAQNIMLQDNQSNIRLMVNGKKSSTKWAKHMDVRFFFMYNVIKHGEIYLLNTVPHETCGLVYSRNLCGDKFSARYTARS